MAAKAATQPKQARCDSGPSSRLRPTREIEMTRSINNGLAWVAADFVATADALAPRGHDESGKAHHGSVLSRTSLSGDQSGRYAVKVDKNWRITFGWSADGPDAIDVDYEDYH
jgi:hypothetical protein